VIAPATTELELARGASSSLTRISAVPFRKEPNKPDTNDANRVALVNGLWVPQDSALRGRDRGIEENVRMLCGQQWSVFNPTVGRWIDVSQFLSDDEKRWRQRPVFNRLLPWFMLMHARMTENPAIVAHVPGPDRIDAMLAETLDVVMKALWRECQMADAWDRVAAWMLVAGRGHMVTRFDPTLGEKREWKGRASVPLYGPDGQPISDQYGQPVMVEAEDVPHDKQGQPVAVMTQDGLQQTGEAHSEPDGSFVVDVPSPMEVRGEWGPTPWHLKSWHMLNTYQTPEQVFAQYGVEVRADNRANVGKMSSGETARLLFGSGYYGPASTVLGGDASTAEARENFVNVRCLWTRPTGPGDKGRFLCVAGDQVLYDGERPVQFKYTSPIRTFDFVRVPGRWGGTAPIEPLIGPQRAYNRRWAQVLDHGALCSNPKPVIDKGSGLQPGQWSNTPGEPVFLNRRPGVPAVEWITPPQISADAWRLLNELRNEFDDLSMRKGAEGQAPTQNASGELVKELRFNSDRPMGATLKRAVEEFARWDEDMIAYIPAVWPFEKVMRYAGDDNRVQTITVQPYLFETGHVDVVPDAESMLPEGRGERQERVYRMWMDGAFGPPDSPEARRHYLELARFPNMGRAAKVGGVDQVMQEHETARMLSGEPSPPVLEWHDHLIHLDTLERYMKSPEFMEQTPEVQNELVNHRIEHLELLMQSAPPPPTSGGDGSAGAPPDGPAADAALPPG
jgi:hypothetical protein